MGRYGGAAFVVAYLLIVLLIAVPALMGEWALGRHAKRGTVGAFAAAGVPGGTALGWFFFVVVVTATNHAELLDRAVWRRFQLRLNLPAPTPAQRAAWFERFEETLGVPLGLSPKTLATRLPVQTFSDLEQFCEDVHRRYVLALPGADLKRILTERLSQWKERVGPTPADRP